jgi:hypothetical protein
LQKKKSEPEPVRFHFDYRSLLPYADLGDQAEDIVVRHVIEWAHVFFFEALAQVFGGYKTGFAIGQVAPGFVAEFHEGGVGQSDDVGLAIDKKLRVDRIRVARGDAIPHVRKAALKSLACQFGSHFEGADELAHGASVRQ